MTEQVQFGFFIDTTKCTGCKTCHVACKDDNSRLATGSILPDGSNEPTNLMPVEGKWRRVYEFGGGTMGTNGKGAFTGFSGVFSYYASIGCNHCSHPVCVQACPTGACHKRQKDGLVHIDQNVCIGCQSCERACPYDAPQFDNDRGVMTKCDGCYDHIDTDLSIPLASRRKPHCVESCPLRAIDFGTIDELRALYGSNADIQGLPSSSITDPNLIIKVNPVSGKGTASHLNPFEV
ncbi:4Fe-4S dicluster domain-containing protein [Ferrimonas lipolytica]|uniref:4Fe-4S dicluster domain-containing protein n=1 Tax=Ferrimonas lipolytica TaxID=2724191 RepID=A0A6H1UHF7_9GAMM|nr:4Fe-4S dicluster domain-containing protein [Ferrimonas lipolytica]QIZ78258.1 4Fe-4S dicluster domain-containing protein [Ferrimonas lipolytica]